MARRVVGQLGVPRLPRLAPILRFVRPQPNVISLISSRPNPPHAAKTARHDRSPLGLTLVSFGQVLLSLPPRRAMPGQHLSGCGADLRVHGRMPTNDLGRA